MNKTISVVIPMRDSAQHLHLVLPPLLGFLKSKEVLEVIVVDDVSTDNGAEVCRDAGLTVISAARRLGPGGCRNLGASYATGDILLFVDSDVVMRSDVPARVRAAFAREPSCVGVFGSYDDDPAARTVVSLYKNLLHHFMHQRAREQATTFWAGCGAVDRAAFLAAGGFDAERFPYPSIEDIELGRRLLRRPARIVLDKALLAKHLKVWTLLDLVRTDVLRRALPWSRMILETGDNINDLNVSSTEILKAGIAAGLAVSVVGMLQLPSLGVIAGLFAVLAFVANLPFFSLVARRGGLIPMAGAFFLHELYYLYSAATYMYCLAERTFMLHRPLPAQPRKPGPLIAADDAALNPSKATSTSPQPSKP